MAPALLLLTILSQSVDLSKAGAWEKVGDGVWSFLRDGTIVGERDTSLPPSKTDPDQAWLYTKQEFGEYDLHVEWWTRWRGNSGISIRDNTRARYSFGAEADPMRTPSRNGYEIQISNGYPDKFPTGSIYLFQAAKTGLQISNDWNTFVIRVRDNLIQVELNGVVVAEHPGDPGRPKRGPIGLQLHDGKSVAMFRNIRLREVR